MFQALWLVAPQILLIFPPNCPDPTPLPAKMSISFVVLSCDQSHGLVSYSLPVNLDHAKAMKHLETTCAIIRKIIFLHKISLDVG